MITLVLVLAGYAVVVSAALVVTIYRRAGNEDVIATELAALKGEAGQIKERVEVLKALADFRRNDIRWYERAVSTLGVAALITTTVAAGVQSIRTVAQDRQLEDSQRRVADIEGRVGRADKLIASVSADLIKRASRAAALSDDDKQILRYRLERLHTIDAPSAAQTEEAITIALVLRDFALIVRYIDERPALFNDARLPDQVALAEYYYLIGSTPTAREMTDRIWSRRQSLVEVTRMRLLTLRVLLGQSSRDDAVAEAMRVTSLSRQAAEVAVDGDVAAFLEGAKRLRTDR